MCEADRGSGLLTTFLEQNDAPCPVCSYSLRRLTSDKCPECGAKLELRVGSEDLRLGRWIALLLTLALPFGFGSVWCFFLSLFVIRDALTYGSLRLALSTYTSIWPVIALSIFNGLLLIVAIRWRRRFWRLPHRVQRVWLCIAFVLTGIALGTWFWWFYV